jgi:hypothetical protein
MSLDNDPRFHHATELVRGWLLTHCLGDRELDALDQEMLVMASEAGALVWWLDCQQQMSGALPPKLVAAYEAAARDYAAAIMALDIHETRQQVN